MVAWLAERWGWHIEGSSQSLGEGDGEPIGTCGVGWYSRKNVIRDLWGGGCGARLARYTGAVSPGVGQRGVRVGKVVRPDEGTRKYCRA